MTIAPTSVDSAGLPSLARKPIYAPRGMVATTQPLAVAAGLHVLRRGGSAVDAAVSTAVALTIVQPDSNNIGGDLFAIVWDGQRLHGLNASGRSPASLTRDRVVKAAASAGAPASVESMPIRGWLPVTVPGAPGGWRDLHARFGRLPFSDLFEDAICYAERGFPVSPTVARVWRRALGVHADLTGPEFAGWADIFAPGGRTPGAGQAWRNPDAAKSLRLIATSGAEAFYSGEIAKAMVTLSERTGGTLAAVDLAEHASLWTEPVSASYRGHEVWELPPNGQGIAALLALSILDGVDLTSAPVEQRVHTQIEAMKLAFADAHAYVADPELAPAPVSGLLAPEYVASRRALLTDSATTPAPGAPARGGTVYLCAVDAQGMMVSLIQSNYMGFGSYIAVPGYGFCLQNRGAGFVLDPKHPNVVAPGKRPYHTIIPGFLTRDGGPVGPFGVMGGHMQPQGHVQLVAATVDARLDPQAALDAPRWYWDSGQRVLVEPEYGASVVSGLRGRGHDAEVAAHRAVFGCGQAIWRNGSGAGYVGGSEPRADGQVAGY